MKIKKGGFRAYRLIFRPFSFYHKKALYNGGVTCYVTVIKSDEGEEEEYKYEKEYENEYENNINYNL